MTAYLDFPVPVAALRLVCFPHAGGGTAVYRRWRNRLGPGVAVCPVQLPGRERRAGERRFTDMDAQVAELDAELRPHLDTPHVFFGHSMGALLAYRLTQRRRANGASLPRAIVLSSPITTISPLLTGGAGVPASERGSRRSTFRRSASRHSASRHSASRRPVAAASPAELAPTELAQQLVELGGLPGDALARPDWLEVLLPVVRDDLMMCESATDLDVPPLPVPFHAFGGQQDPLVPPAALGEWQRHTLVGMDMKLFAGGHFYLREGQEQFLPVLRSTVARYVGDTVHRAASRTWDSDYTRWTVPTVPK